MWFYKKVSQNNDLVSQKNNKKPSNNYEKNGNTLE